METENYGSLIKNLRQKMARLTGCSLDSLVGELDPEYSETAIDRKLYQNIIKLDVETKEKLLKTLEIWSK